MHLTSLSTPGSSPASMRSIDQDGKIVAKRLASNEPAVPAPTIMKSYDTPKIIIATKIHFPVKAIIAEKIS